MRGRYAYVVLAVLMLALSAANVLWTAHEVTVNEQKWCALVSTIDQANAAASKQPAPGTFSAQFVAEIHTLRGELGCG